METYIINIDLTTLQYDLALLAEHASILGITYTENNDQFEDKSTMKFEKQFKENVKEFDILLNYYYRNLFVGKGDCVVRN